MTDKVLRSEAEWRVLGRFVKARSTPYQRCELTGAPLFAEFQTFTNGEHPYHVPNYIGGDDAAIERD